MLLKVGSAAHSSKASEEARLVVRKVSFFWMPAIEGGGVQRLTPPTDN